MKAVKSKAQERQEIETQIRQFLDGGGRVQTVQAGVSGRDPGSARMPTVSFHTPKQERTPLLAEIRAIEERRRGGRGKSVLQPRGPRRVLITDDFGEPLRWSWRDS